MEITVDDDTVKVSGEAVSQEMKEKVILAVGNVKGVSAVEDSVPSAGEPVSTPWKKATRFGRYLPRLWAAAHVTKKYLKRTNQCLATQTKFIRVKCCVFCKLKKWGRDGHLVDHSPLSRCLIKGGAVCAAL
jgi:hypothetical protein